MTTIPASLLSLFHEIQKGVTHPEFSHVSVRTIGYVTCATAYYRSDKSPTGVLATASDGTSPDIMYPDVWSAFQAWRDGRYFRLPVHWYGKQPGE